MNARRILVTAQLCVVYGAGAASLAQAAMDSVGLVVATYGLPVGLVAALVVAGVRLPRRQPIDPSVMAGTMSAAFFAGCCIYLMVVAPWALYGTAGLLLVTALALLTQTRRPAISIERAQ